MEEASVTGGSPHATVEEQAVSSGHLTQPSKVGSTQTYDIQEQANLEPDNPDASEGEVTVDQEIEVAPDADSTTSLNEGLKSETANFAHPLAKGGPYPPRALQRKRPAPLNVSKLANKFSESDISEDGSDLLTPEIMPPTPSEDHQALLDSLDIALQPKPWKNPNWKPSSRRNKSVKQIIAEQQRREASVMATQNNSGTTTPAQQSTRAGTPSGDSNGTGGSGNTGANITQASRNLQAMVLERNMQASNATAEAQASGDSGPVATYTNIEAAPSLQAAQQKKYCDITGLPAPYTDPKTGLRYANKEIFKVIRELPPGVAEQYLAARNANTILK